MGVPTKLGFNALKCPGEVGEGTIYVEPCDISILRRVRRIIFMRQNGTNPFATAGAALVEATMDIFLALTEINSPNNPYYSPDLWEITKAPGAANIVTSNSNQPDVTNYADSNITFSYANINSDAENELAVTIRSNKKNLQVIFVTENNELVYRATSNLLTENLEFIPLKLATMQDKSSDGVNNNELNTGNIYIQSEKNFNWRLLSLPYNLLSKTQ